ncbi:MAG: hypothetical protein LBQ83_04700 [Candidatus Margulisbacteria bacterium]|jgi:hypothetical protein|nr:hypothetical protein [Candidatus Margulisiibacteriota bacterium]
MTIAKGQPMLAQDIIDLRDGLATKINTVSANTTAALDTKENTSNKATALSSASTNTQYPSAKAVYDNLALKENASNKVTTLSSTATGTQYPSAKVVYDNLAAKQDKIAAGTASNIVAYSGIAGTLNTLDRVTSVRAAASALDTAIPTEKAVAAVLVAKANASEVSALSFFPKGTILMYDSQLWDRAGGITGWHICDGQAGTINLTDKFIRGGSASRQTGGTDTAQLLKHQHPFVGDKQEGEIGFNKGLAGTSYGSAMFEVAGTHAAEAITRTGVFSGSEADWAADMDNSSGQTYQITKLKFSMTPTGAISEEGVANADNRPAFCTVIFIEKIV